MYIIVCDFYADYLFNYAMHFIRCNALVLPLFYINYKDFLVRKSFLDNS